MKILIVLLTFFSIVFSSCLFQEKYADVDPFYTSKAHYQFPRIPLVEPIFMTYEKESNKWGIEIPYSIDNALGLKNLTHDGLNEIGAYKNYIYGYIPKKTKQITDYEKGNYVFLDKFNISYTSIKKRNPDKNEIQVNLNDDKVFVLPKRWFVINTKNNSSEAFFFKKNYENYLKKNSISGKMYNTSEMHKQFFDTGILPWFPDSVKTKLSK